MALRIRRGTENERQVTALDNGEVAWTSDTQKMYVGLGTGQVGNAGMVNILSTSAGNGLTFNAATHQLDINNAALNLTTTDVGEGINQYFTQERAQDAAAILLTSGTHSGITFTYQQTQDLANRIDASVTLALTSLSDVNIVGTPATGSTIKWNGTKWVVGTDVDTGLNNIVEDVSPQLGGDLSLNGNDITGTGNINFLGSLTVGDNTESVNIQARAEGPVIKSTNEELVLESAADSGAQVRINVKPSSTTGGAILTGITGIQTLELRSFKNGATAPNPGDVASGDIIAGISFSGWLNTTLSDIPAIIGAQVDPAGTLTSSHIPTKIFIGNQPATSGGIPTIMTFDSRGRLAVNQENAQATVDINGVMRLVKQTAMPSSPVEGMIAVADRVTWDPAGVGSGGSYPVYFDGSNWYKLT